MYRKKVFRRPDGSNGPSPLKKDLLREVSPQKEIFQSFYVKVLSSNVSQASKVKNKDNANQSSDSSYAKPNRNKNHSDYRGDLTNRAVVKGEIVDIEGPR